MKRRVVVTGIGCVTPLGNNINDMWASLQEGRSGVGPITHFDATNFPTRFAAEVRGYDFDSYVPDPSRFADAGRNTRFAIGAASQAVNDSGINQTVGFDPHVQPGDGLKAGVDCSPIEAEKLDPEVESPEEVVSIHGMILLI